MDHPNTLVREYVENGADWQYKEIARTLYGWGDIFRTEFFGDAIPQPLIAVAAKRMNTLASYRLIPNPDGLPYEITFNEQYIDAPLWATLEVLLHEMVHLFQETTPGMQSCGTYVCGTNACRVSCSSDSDCTTGNYCTGPNGSCLSKKALAATCGADHECGSGSCTDGVCCTVSA
jgi:hypothetical protein